MENPSLLPADIVGDAVGKIDASERVLPVTRAMAELVHQAAGADQCSLSDLLQDRADLERLSTGEEVVVAVGGGDWRLTKTSSGDGHWLVARERSEREVFELTVFATARARALARIAASVAHDLNNQLNAMLGLASQVRGQLKSDSDRDLVGQLETGTRVGARMLRVLARLLVRGEERAEVVGMDRVLEDALAVIRKSIVSAGTDLSVQICAGVPTVRTVPSLATQALLHGLLAMTYHPLQSLTVELVAEDHCLAGGRSRRCVRIGCNAVGIAASHAEAFVDVAAMKPGAITECVRQLDWLDGVATSACLLGWLGGELTGKVTSDGLRVDFYLSAASAG